MDEQCWFFYLVSVSEILQSTFERHKLGNKIYKTLSLLFVHFHCSVFFPFFQYIYIQSHHIWWPFSFTSFTWHTNRTSFFFVLLHIAGENRSNHVQKKRWREFHQYFVHTFSFHVMKMIYSFSSFIEFQIPFLLFLLFRLYSLTTLCTTYRPVYKWWMLYTLNNNFSRKSFEYDLIKCDEPRETNKTKIQWNSIWRLPSVSN